MKFTNFGGATGILEHDGKRMLFDPWLDDGIFHGSWFHYPPVRMKPQDLGRLDYVYISHIHEDHCSAGTIEHINRDAEVILMDRHPNFVARFLETHGFKFAKVHLVPPQTPTRIAPGLTVDMVTADPEHDLNFAIDSALVLDWGGTKVYNANDCLPYPDGLKYVRDTYGKVDLALLPYAGGSGYPACYANLTDDQKHAERRRIAGLRIDGFRAAVAALEPRYAMPFADQYVIGGSRARLNKYMAHPPCGGVLAEPYKTWGLRSELLLLNSGQSIDLATGQKTPDTAYHVHTEAERDAYIERNLLGARYDHEGLRGNRAPPLFALLKAGRARMWAAQQKEGFAPPFFLYVLDDDGHRFEIDLSKDGLRSLEGGEPLRQPYLSVKGPAPLLVLLLSGYMSWNIADAALFIDYERVPNKYDPQVYVMLNHLRV